MSVHECLEFVFLLELLTGRESFLLLLLIEHHLLDGLASRVIEVRQLRVLRLNLLGVDLGVALNDAVPPVHAVHLHKRELESALCAICLKGPEGVGSLDLLV